MSSNLFILMLLHALFNCVHLQEKCVIEDHVNGECKPVKECPSAIEDIKNRLKPQICRFVGRDPIVCCPENVSGRKCVEYGKEVESYQVFAIVGGEATFIFKFPHMAALGYGDSNNIQWGCGGSLLSERFILTAAHCLKSELGFVNFVRMGETNLNNQFREDKDFKVIKTYRHPEYKPPALYHDIALIEIDKPANFSPWIKPACLHTEPTINLASSTFEATGWGATDFGEAGTTFLQRVALQLFNNQECNLSYRNSPKRLPQGVQEDKQLCAGGRDEEKDTCQGDSGGPLQVYRSAEGLHGIVGVTSFGKGCGTANIPGVYTKVSYYVPWIERIVWP